jgi:putative membrane protein
VLVQANAVLAHSGRPPEPHDVWGAWNLDPVLLFGLCVTAWAYWRGANVRRPHAVRRWREWCFAGGLATVAVALVSPIEAMSGALASAHMVQHMLLVLVAAPLLALGAPATTMLRGSPVSMRRFTGEWRRRLRLRRSHARLVRRPASVWLLHVGTLWFWHAAKPYGAALEHELLHVVEHASFLITGVLFWSVVMGARSAARVSEGVAILLVFTMAMQSIFLSALLTFAKTPWYPAYTDTTAAWHLDPLADQQLAGVIMWVPAGMVYVAAGLALVVAWIRVSEREALTL